MCHVIENLKSEKDMLLASERQLMREVESLLRERQSQNALLVNLRQMQDSMKHTEEELQARLANQFEAMQREADQARKRLDDESTRNRLVQSHLNGAIEGLRHDLEHERKTLQSTRERLVSQVLLNNITLMQLIA
jgi:hypothetical protein